jgi:hypothetical protein
MLPIRFNFVRFAYCIHIQTLTLKVRKLDVNKSLINFEEYKVYCPSIKVYTISCHRRHRGEVGSGVRALTLVRNLGAK